MKIVISTFGTRGDVQPYIALGIGLQQAGHQVTLVTSSTYSDWIQFHGLNVHPVSFSPHQFMQQPEVQATMKRGNPVRMYKMMRTILKQSAAANEDFWQAAQNADFVVQSGTGVGALEAAEKLGIPSAMANLVPAAPTRAFPSFFLGSLRFSFGPGYNYLTHGVVQRVLWAGVGGSMTNEWRKKLGLRPWRSHTAMLNYARSLGTPVLYGFSSHVIPKPADWDEHQHITGYWFLDTPADWQPAPELAHFLENGTPPVYLGFGSINVGDGEEKTRMALRALEISQQRGVVLTGWGGFARLPAPDRVLFVDNVPHDWLFPRMAAVMHHGGAGSTGAGLRAGVPGIVAAFAGDQCAWAEQVVKLGVGPRVPGIKKLNAESLAKAIRTTVTDPTMRARAAALGDKIRAENGVARAVEIIERHAANF